MYEHRGTGEGVTTFAFLNEHLYQVALRGGYRNELEQVRTYLPDLQRFNSAGELLRVLRQDAKLREKTVSELETLWQENYDLRPASGAILMLALWTNAPAASADYWYDYFVELAKGKSPDVTSGLRASKAPMSLRGSKEVQYEKQ